MEDNQAMDYVSLSLKTYNELYEKAKKYDELQGNHVSIIDSNLDDLPF